MTTQQVRTFISQAQSVWCCFLSFPVAVLKDLSLQLNIKREYWTISTLSNTITVGWNPRTIYTSVKVHSNCKQNAILMPIIKQQNEEWVYHLWVGRGALDRGTECCLFSSHTWRTNYFITIWNVLVIRLIGWNLSHDLHCHIWPWDVNSWENKSIVRHVSLFHCR